jgi:CubicO group peptidase (beta-lactamase class C family)
MMLNGGVLDGNRLLGRKTVNWGGAANTTFWIDPKEELVGILMTQFMPSGTYPVNEDFRNLVYQAIDD